MSFGFRRYYEKVSEFAKSYLVILFQDGVTCFEAELESGAAKLLHSISSFIQTDGIIKGWFMRAVNCACSVETSNRSVEFHEGVSNTLSISSWCLIEERYFLSFRSKRLSFYYVLYVSLHFSRVLCTSTFSFFLFSGLRFSHRVRPR